MNFIETFKLGKAGRNMGLDTGIPALNKAINGLQKKTSIGLAAAPKVGKTTLSDFAFVISPYLEIERKEAERLTKLDELIFTAKTDEERLALQEKVTSESLWKNVHWIYFSFEIDRVSKEFKYAAFFMAHDYKQYTLNYKGKSYLMSPTYLSGKMVHENADGSVEAVPVTEEHERMLKEIYVNRIVPMFGEYSATGLRIKEGLIDFIEIPENPTGLYKYVYHYAQQHGRFVTEKVAIKSDTGKVESSERVVGYQANNPDQTVIIVTDHIRKLKRERGYTMKENIDKWLEYSTILRNICWYTFIHIIHSNRGIANVDRLRYAGEWIFPTSDDSKDSGNPAEECTIFMTLFNPNDEKYNLERHFGIELKDFPHYRSLHITEARDTECPVHMQLNMLGNINMFYPLVPVK